MEDIAVQAGTYQEGKRRQLIPEKPIEPPRRVRIAIETLLLDAPRNDQASCLGISLSQSPTVKALTQVEYSRKPKKKDQISGSDTPHADRGSDSANGADDLSPRVREFRPPWKEEHGDFVWYHRIDLKLGWNEVHKRFKQAFPDEKRTLAGLQCAFYRILDDYKITKISEQARDEHLQYEYGMRYNTGRRYSWTEPDATDSCT